MTIEQTDIEFLEANRHHYDVWVRAQYIQHLDGATRSRMLAIIRKYFSSGYLADLWCQTCVAQMIIYLYVQYEKYKSVPVELETYILPNANELMKQWVQNNNIHETKNTPDSGNRQKRRGRK